MTFRDIGTKGLIACLNCTLLTSSNKDLGKAKLVIARREKSRQNDTALLICKSIALLIALEKSLIFRR